RMEAVDLAGEIDRVDQAVADHHAGDGSLDSGVRPDAAALRDVADLAGVDAVQQPAAAAVRGVLADRGVDAAVVEDRRRDDLAGAGRTPTPGLNTYLHLKDFSWFPRALPAQ